MTASSASHRLRLFGAPTIERSDGAAVVGPASHRHRVALLALLALAPGNRMSRDKLIALLWPDSDAERGRNLLNVSAYTIRKALGDAALRTTGDDLQLDAGVVASDVEAFALAIAEGDAARAVVLYTGPFLDGFYVSGAPDLEAWIDRERARLADERARALETLATAAERDGDAPRAVEWWKARAAGDPLDSRVALRLIAALDASGNRSGALQHAAMHRRLLAQELGAAAAPPALGELEDRLRREPAAVPSPPPSAMAVTAANGAASAASAASAAQPTAAMPRASAPRRWSWGAALAVVVIVVGTRVWARRPTTPDAERSIVVLPFVNMSPNADDAYFADGLTEEVIARLAAVQGLKVISRTSAMHYKRSTQPLRDIARELHVAQALEGSVRWSGGRVRVTAQLIDAATDEHRWAESFEYDRQSSFRVQEDIARAVAEVLAASPSAQARRQLARRGTSNAEAYELYQRARVLWQTRTAAGHEQAIALYERAIALDSGYADAYAGLSDAHLTAWQNNVLGLSEAESYSRMKWAAERALALDDESAAAHTSFAIVLWWQKNWPGAMRELRRSLELNPGQAMTRSWYSLLLRATGHAADATRENRSAAELDPYAVAIAHNVAWHCYHDRDYACAIAADRRTVAIGGYPPSYATIAVAASQLGRHAEALDAMRQGIALAPQRAELLADLAYVQARAGNLDEARASLQRAKSHPEVEGLDVARAHVALHEADSAFAWLDRASLQWPHRALLDDPALDPVRADPRFERLRARITREMGLR